MTCRGPACSRQSVKPPVEAPASSPRPRRHVDAESVERGRELLAATRHKTGPFALHHDGLVGSRPDGPVCRPARPRRRLARPQSPRRPASPARHQPPPHQLGVEATTHPYRRVAAFLAGAFFFLAAVLAGAFFLAAFFGTARVPTASPRAVRGLPSWRCPARRSGAGPPCAWPRSIPRHDAGSFRPAPRRMPGPVPVRAGPHGSALWLCAAPPFASPR